MKTHEDFVEYTRFELVEELIDREALFDAVQLDHKAQCDELAATYQQSELGRKAALARVEELEKLLSEK